MIGELIQSRGLESLGRFYSKYRGIVVDNNDPDNLNRIKVIVPEVIPSISEWSYPSNQSGNIDSGFKFQTPKIGSIVWIEYQNGDPLYPIWSYYGWAIDEVPEDLKNPNSLGIVTNNGNKIILDDDNGILKIQIVDKNDVNKVLSSLEVNQDIVTITGTKMILFKDDHGIPLSDKVTDKLNNLENEINRLKSLLSQSVSQVKPSDGGASALTFISSQFSQQLVNTKISDIENPNIKQ